MRKDTLEEIRIEADIMAANIVLQVESSGGHTFKPYQPLAQLEPYEWTVSLKYTECVVAFKSTLQELLSRRIFTNTLLWVLHKASRCVGVWHDKEFGVYEVADVVLFDNQQDAEMFARTQNQRYIYNLVAGNVAVPPADKRSDNG